MVEDVTVEFENPFKPHSPQFVDDGHSPSEEELLEEEEYENQDCVPDEIGAINLEYKRKAVDYWKSGKKQRLSLQTVQHRFKKVTSRGQLSRWETSLEKGGTRREKLIDISTYVYNMFVEKSESGGIIHDIDLRKCALEANEHIALNDFKASTHWVYNFKKVYNIVSRKINKFVTRAYKGDFEELKTVAAAFVETIKPKIIASGVNNVYNADESGFNLELHSGRTLAVEGLKTIDATVQSVSATTHSYTILPTVSASGKALKQLFIVLKEQGGTFGPKVQQTVFKASNVYVTASTSGKLTSGLFNEWFTNVFLENTGSESILLLDSWTGHCPTSLLKTIPSTKRLEIFTIPKKTTSVLQPLDVYGFRIWKNFVRKFSDMVILYNHGINLHARNNIIKLQSLVHNQFSAARYNKLFSYAWYKSGYIPEKPDKVDNPVDYAFRSQDLIQLPRCSKCGQYAIIRCSWCDQYLCFKHFFEEYHYHDQE